jgi:hypothetical protein
VALITQCDKLNLLFGRTIAQPSVQMLAVGGSSTGQFYLKYANSVYAFKVNRLRFNCYPIIRT